jgi:hypothetical protein
MSTRPDWAMDRAAAILALIYTQMTPGKQLEYIADYLVITHLEGERDGMARSKEIFSPTPAAELQDA